MISANAWVIPPWPAANIAVLQLESMATGLAPDRKENVNQQCGPEIWWQVEDMIEIWICRNMPQISSKLHNKKMPLDAAPNMAQFKVKVTYSKPKSKHQYLDAANLRRCWELAPASAKKSPYTVFKCHEPLAHRIIRGTHPVVAIQDCFEGHLDESSSKPPKIVGSILARKQHNKSNWEVSVVYQGIYMETSIGHD